MSLLPRAHSQHCTAKRIEQKPRKGPQANAMAMQQKLMLAKTKTHNLIQEEERCDNTWHDLL